MSMAFDIFLQPLADGEASRADAVATRELVDSHMVDANQGWARLKTADGSADLYGYDDLGSGFMVNHATGNAIWDLLVAFASAGPFAILPVGGPTCVTDSSLVTQLPSELTGDVVVVSSGREQLRVISSS